MSRKLVAYFAHDPAHRLLPAESGGDNDDGGGNKFFTCDGCLVAGAGRRYRCSHPGCGFKVHEACARAFPRKLKSTVHPEHRLRRQLNSHDDGSCDVCGEAVKGACYGCAACGVAVHPLCVRLPGSARGPAHASGGHNAWLVRVASTSSPSPPPSSNSSSASASAPPAWPWACAACGRPVGAWRYRCVTCREDLHPRCLVPATDQCLAAGEGQHESSLAKRCCCGLLRDVTRCLATTGTALEYRGYYNGE